MEKFHYGHKVIFLDGNKRNLDIQNLILVSDSESLIMNTNKLRFENEELTKTGYLVAKLINKTNEIRRTKQ